MWPRKVSVIGLGLLGGSIALSLKENLPNIEIVGFSRNPIKYKDVGNAYCFSKILSYSDFDSIGNSDVVVICTPVFSIIDIFSDIKNFLGPDTLVTDVGSTKKLIVQSINHPRFIGSHPMSGSDKSGLENASSRIMDNALVVVTPLPVNISDNVNRIKTFWEIMGCKVIVMDPERHDRIVGYTSHFVHLIAYGISLYFSKVREEDKNDILKLFGKGFLDTTRIAKSDPHIWIDIFSSNRDNILEYLGEFIKILIDLKDCLSSDDKEKLFYLIKSSKDFRDKFKDY